MISFAKKVKKELSEIDIKLKNCCGYALLYGMLYTSDFDADFAQVKVLNEDVGKLFVSVCQQLSIKSVSFYYEKNKIKINKSFLRFFSLTDIKKNMFKCARCKEFFLRGLFLVNGTVNDPEKSYRLELLFTDSQRAEEVYAFLFDIGVSALKTTRANKIILYLKRSESIEDFFASMGATSLAFDIMNSKINKELINNANRVTNCDAANINKSLKASDKYNSVINYLIETQNINKLPVHLQQMAEKRIEYKELSFSELGKQFSPPISKSGVYHRLEKIVDFYNDLINK